MITKTENCFTIYKWETVKLGCGHTKSVLVYQNLQDQPIIKDRMVSKPALAVWYDDVPNPEVPRIEEDPMAITNAVVAQ